MHRAGLLASWLAGMTTSVWMLFVTGNPVTHDYFTDEHDVTEPTGPQEVALA